MPFHVSDHMGFTVESLLLVGHYVWLPLKSALNSLTLFPELSIAWQKAGQGPWNKVKVDTVYKMDSNGHFPMYQAYYHLSELHMWAY